MSQDRNELVRGELEADSWAHNIQRVRVKMRRESGYTDDVSVERMWASFENTPGRVLLSLPRVPMTRVEWETVKRAADDAWNEWEAKFGRLEATNATQTKCAVCGCVLAPNTACYRGGGACCSGCATRYRGEK